MSVNPSFVRSSIRCSRSFGHSDSTHNGWGPRVSLVVSTFQVTGEPKSPLVAYDEAHEAFMRVVDPDADDTE